MTKKIDKLTDDQIAMMDVYKDKWIDIGLCQDPIDVEKTSEIIRNIYAAQNLDAPEIIYSTSPKKSKEILGEDYNTANACYGFHDAGFLSYYDYFAEVVGVEGLEPIKNLVELSKVCGWWYPFDTMCVIEERPILRMEEMPDGSGNKWCHSDDKLAIEYPDGWGVAVVEGKRIPNSEWITNPESITMDVINATDDNDLLTILLDRYGWDKYYEEIQAEPMDNRKCDISGQYEALFQTSKLGKRLLVTCPTARMFSLPCHDDTVVNCETAQEFLMGKSDTKEATGLTMNVIART